MVIFNDDYTIYLSHEPIKINDFYKYDFSFEH